MFVPMAECHNMGGEIVSIRQSSVLNAVGVRPNTEATAATYPPSPVQFSRTVQSIAFVDSHGAAKK